MMNGSSVSRKSRLTPLAVSTTTNGPNERGAASPSSSLRNAAPARLSVEWTIVWLSSTAMSRRYSLRVTVDFSYDDRRHERLGLLTRLGHDRVEKPSDCALNRAP